MFANQSLIWYVRITILIILAIFLNVMNAGLEMIIMHVTLWSIKFTILEPIPQKFFILFHILV